MMHVFKVGFPKWAGVLFLAAAFGFGWLSATNAGEPVKKEGSAAPPHELAIFPWRMVGVGSDTNDAVWKGFREAMRKAGLFAAKYSYYATKNGRDTPMIPSDLLNKSVEADLWVRKDKMGWFRPDVNAVSSLAHRLDVDAVIMYSLDRTRQWITMQVFLVDVEKRTGFRCETNGRTFPRGPSARSRDRNNLEGLSGISVEPHSRWGRMMFA